MAPNRTKSLQSLLCDYFRIISLHRTCKHILHKIVEPQAFGFGRIQMWVWCSSVTAVRSAAVEDYMAGQEGWETMECFPDAPKTVTAGMKSVQWSNVRETGKKHGNRKKDENTVMM